MIVTRLASLNHSFGILRPRASWSGVTLVEDREERLLQVFWVLRHASAKLHQAATPLLLAADIADLGDGVLVGHREVEDVSAAADAPTAGAASRRVAVAADALD